MSRSMMPAFSANTVAIPGIPSLSWLGSKSFGMEMTAGQVLALPIVLTRNSIPDTAIWPSPTPWEMAVIVAS